MILGTDRPFVKCLEPEYFEILDFFSFFFLVVDIFIYVVNYLGDGIQV